MKRVNLGCGEEKIKGCINVDINSNLKPDVVANFLEPLPFESRSIDIIYFFHVIEHLPKKLHSTIILNIQKVLKEGGVLYIAYPEFVKCAEYFIKNHKGKREFFEATIYGRQNSQFDFHISLMYTPHFVNLLQGLGFEVEVKQEKEDWNTICKCTLVRPSITIEDIYRKEWYAINQGSLTESSPEHLS
jgi:SAM-dependent methyltransferase